MARREFNERRIGAHALALAAAFVAELFVLSHARAEVTTAPASVGSTSSAARERNAGAVDEGAVASVATPSVLSRFLSLFGREAETAPDPRRIPETLMDKDNPWGPLQIVVFKKERKLKVYRFGQLDREYSVVLGLKPDGRKRFAFDARTPEGKYHITGKRPHGRWQYFLAIDYPNDADKALYATELQSGLIPALRGRPFGIGSDLGIHGNDRPQEQASGQNWTKGCVAMGEQDIADLYSIVEVGTPVWLVQ
ncbi:MAG TPA: L,D-transpeptidase [Candidatus Binatia bacterium]|nr:L,D-transpeptidase [Candidatus Binatia bacterium]